MKIVLRVCVKNVFSFSKNDIFPMFYSLTSTGKHRDDRCSDINIAWRHVPLGINSLVPGRFQRNEEINFPADFSD